MKKQHVFHSRFVIAATLLTLAGCSSPKAPAPEQVPPPPRAPEVAAAEKLFDSGHTQDAIIACVDISKKNPEANGLTDLQQRITQKPAEDRLAAANKKAASTARLHSADALSLAVSPERYRQKKNVIGDRSALKTAPTAMQKALQNPVSVHLVNADVNAIIAQIGQSENINIIADSDISPKTLTIHAEKTPLIEVLDYIGRNLNVTFSVGDNLIWVTPKIESSTGVPLETRVYRLRKGMVGSELGKTAQGVSLFKGPEERGSGNALQAKKEDDSQKKEGKVGLLESIEHFVPQPEGADFLFNDKVHALVVKNTRENLALVEDLIEAMDVRPLQILIEARFVTTSLSDMRKLGVEWLIDNRGSSQFTTGFTSDGGWVSGNTKGDQARRDVFTGSLQGVTDAGVGGGSFAYQFLLGDTALQAVLNALEKTGESRTVVVPRVTTLNNREARFRVGEDTSYFEEVDTNIMTSGDTTGTSRDNVTYNYDRPTIVETGYSLIVTPSVGADLSSINMVLRPEISAVKEWKKYKLSSLDNADSSEDEPQIEVPIISRQYIETEAVVRSGETVVLGGLMDASKTENNSGTPWLSTLPWIGFLFNTEDKEETTKNILIFVTATLISDVGEELIPLNDFERYGLEVPDAAKVPNILKEEPTVNAPKTATASPKTPVAAPAAAPSAAPHKATTTAPAAKK